MTEVTQVNEKDVLNKEPSLSLLDCEDQTMNKCIKFVTKPQHIVGGLRAQGKVSWPQASGNKGSDLFPVLLLNCAFHLTVKAA